MSRAIILCLTCLLFSLGLRAEDLSTSASPQRVFEYTKTFNTITELMAHVGYTPADEQQVNSFDWSIDDTFEYKWYCKPVGSSEVPFVMVCVNPDRQLNLLAQVDIYSEKIELNAPTYREEMASIAKNLKDVTQALKRS